MSESFDNVIGGGLTLKGGLRLRKPEKRKKHKKEKKRKKAEKKSKKRDKKDKDKKRVRFETGEADPDTSVDPSLADETSLALEGSEGAPPQGGGGGGSKEGEAEGYDPLNDPSLTATQRKHLLVQRQRYSKLADEMFKMTHRQRIEKFNTMLANLSEHHDVPKVGNAGMG